MNGSEAMEDFLEEGWDRLVLNWGAIGEIERRFRGTTRLPVSESQSERALDLNASEGEREEIDDCDS